jgi:coproporphyrinogen III oxidase
VVEELGVRFDKLHHVVEFKQKKWMQPYIEGSNALRTLAKNDFEKDFIKLMNNAVFGQTIPNVRTQMNLHLPTDPKNAIKWFSKCKFKNNTYANGLYLI